jgi:phosphocarrier protein FPr
VAIGPVWLYQPQLPEITLNTVDDPAAEWQRLLAALQAARKEVELVQQQATRRVGATEAAIFEAHALFLQDPALLNDTRQHIESERLNAEAAWQQAIHSLVNTFRGLDDAYMRGRAADVEDVGRRVLRHLIGVQAPSLDFTEPSVLVVADLTPSDTARMDPRQVLAICTEVGGATAHSAILARALGIPAVVGLGPAIWQLGEGQLVAVDGEQGRIWPEPGPEQLEALRRKRQEWLEGRERLKAAGSGEAATQDGRRIEIAANIGGPNDVPVAREYGAEGVGLFRTEFLFFNRDRAPTEEEQLDAYRQAAAGMEGRPMIIRTLDIGGDKPLPYVEMGEEANPFLGWRGIRFCLDRPEIFRPQLRAILRASVDADGKQTNVKIMFPMIGTLAELLAAKQVLVEIQQELRAAGLPFDEQMEVGMMIEVPSAVAIADQLAREVDFFSIGTNDLAQYVMAADRGNARVTGLADALQPAVLRMVKQTVEAGHVAGIWVGMCGELAGNALATPVLVGLGLDELSMSAPSIPAVKEQVRRLTLPQAQEMAAEVLSLNSAEVVAEYLRSNANG